MVLRRDAEKLDGNTVSALITADPQTGELQPSHVSETKERTQRTSKRATSHLTLSLVTSRVNQMIE